MNVGPLKSLRARRLKLGQSRTRIALRRRGTLLSLGLGVKSAQRTRRSQRKCSNKSPTAHESSLGIL
jgi:hypothetical protein